MLTNTKTKWLDLIAILSYATLLILVSCFHEPWFDEAQAWLISRDSGLFEMIWHVLRYEGHPPLWYLVLFVPSHLGLPFEIGLKSAGLMIAISAYAIFIKYSPFPYFIRLLIPYSYFLFYQFGVINRNYTLLMLLLWIIATLFPKRNTKPFAFSFMLALLGGTSAYGTMIAFGIAVAWFFEILPTQLYRTSNYRHALAQTVADRRFKALVLLTVINLLYLAILWPPSDRLNPLLDSINSTANMIFKFVVAPLAAIFAPLHQNSFVWDYPAIGMVLFPVIYIFLILALFRWASKKGMLAYTLLPYLALNLFMTFVYSTLNHIGLYTLIIIFIIWISLDNFTKQSPQNNRSNAMFFTGDYFRKYKHLRYLSYTGLISILLLQLFWTGAASLNDIYLPFAPHRDLAAFIHDNNLEKRKIFDYYFASGGKNSYITGNCSVLAYFRNNIFYNHNPDHPSINYALHREIDDKLLIEYIKSSGEPEVLIWNENSLPFYREIFDISDYIKIKSFAGYYFWKNYSEVHYVTLYIRKDLMGQYPKLKSLTQ